MSEPTKISYRSFRGSAEAIKGVQYQNQQLDSLTPLSIFHFLSLFKTHCSFPHALAFSQMRTGVRAAQKHKRDKKHISQNLFSIKKWVNAIITHYFSTHIQYAVLRWKRLQCFLCKRNTLKTQGKSNAV